ncbi:cysteine desulfurase [Paraliobacillus quinghaiensis]|uniref:cysteine desulfurase n=1 Tax=Paraliobacillus quinghaiensis TaxID=470815 RepID=A0A917WUW1_9BACI|nr:cysteine desulfurase family protein [Paraliobacillus quinghaiensis]GGM30916.1 cysteine desulfurase [Paraliobacillus quinghaiensis]
MDAIYLDHAATSPVHPDVIEAMLPVMKQTFGNPSSIHQYGRKARQLLDQARSVAASSIHANEKNIIFTSGGTEADNIALLGTAWANKSKGNHIITTVIEHHATLRTAESLEKQGFEVTYLPVQQSGQVSVKDLRDALTDQTILVSVMMVNNETGVKQPIQEIGELLIDHQAYFHTDAVQAYGICDLDVNVLNVDLLTVSSHKVNGPKGVGFLYIRDGVQINTIQFGGEQERKRRPGTENVANIVGFKKAIELIAGEKDQRLRKYQSYKQTFLETLKELNLDFAINGEEEQLVPTIVNISFPGTNVESLLMNFDLAGIAVSSGSACTAGSIEPSHVLSEMFGSEDERTVNSIRFSFGLANNEKQIIEAATKVGAIVNRLAS